MACAGASGSVPGQLPGHFRGPRPSWGPCSAHGMKAKSSERAPSISVARTGPVRKLTGKKSKKRFWKKKAQGGSKTPGSAPKGVAGRPPKAREDFSQNWKALQEVRPAAGAVPGLRPGPLKRLWSSLEPSSAEGRSREKRPARGRE